MLKQDLELRARADKGDNVAKVELGLRYLRGAKGLASNHRLALGYLAAFARVQSELAHALATEVSVEDFIRCDCLDLLAAAASDGVDSARAKLGALKALQGDSAGWDTLSEIASEDGKDADTLLAQLLRGKALAQDGQRLVEELLRNSPDGVPTRRALGVALDTYPASTILPRLILRLLERASEAVISLQPLSQSQIMRSMRQLAKQKDGPAVFFLGCALLDLEIGSLTPQAVAPKANHRQGYAFLLRAALSGESRAWYQLFIACSDYRSSVANSEAAQLFLEQAAEANISPALRVLGARTLQAADDLDGLLRGQRMLIKAAREGDLEAERLLATFYGAIGPRAMDRESSAVIAYASGVEQVLGLRLRLARTFSLSRGEVSKLDVFTCVRSQSLVLNKTYALPALTAEAVESLRSVKAWLTAQPSKQVRRPARDDMIIDESLKAAGLAEMDFFRNDQQLGPRTLTSWKSENAGALKRAGNQQRTR
jgi:hypothetical protein